MKKILLILFLLLTTACQDYTEINDFSIISGIILDYTNEYEMISELLINEEETKIEVFKTTGKTIDECLSKISKLANKDIFISHLKTLILTENIINKNINIYDYFLRSSKSKMNFNIYLIDSKIKNELFQINKNESQSEYIQKLTTYNDKIYSTSTQLKFIDLIYKIYEPGLEPLYPNLTITENETNKKIELNNLTFFTNNKQIILTNEQSIYYNLLTNNIDKTILNLKYNDKNYTLLINESKTTKKYNKNKNVLTYQINIKSNVNNNESDLNLQNEKNINKLKEISNQEIKTKINELINIELTNNYDFLGIQNYTYKHNKKTNLEDIKINILINTEINSIGEKRK